MLIFIICGLEVSGVLICMVVLLLVLVFKLLVYCVIDVGIIVVICVCGLE